MAQSAPIPKPRRVTDEEYLDVVRSLPSLIHGRSRGASDPHHLHPRGAAGSDPRIGGTDYAAIPLSRELHDEWHRIGTRRFNEKYSIDLWREAFALAVPYLLAKIERLEKRLDERIDSV